MARVFRMCGYTPRRRFTACLIFLVSSVSLTIFVSILRISHFPQEDLMEKTIADMHSRMRFIESLYRARQEDIIALQNKIYSTRSNTTYKHAVVRSNSHHFTVPPEVVAMMRNLTGMKAASGLQTETLSLMQTSFVYQLLPHLMATPTSLQPAYHLKGGRLFSEVVIGIPTVRRDKESYLMITLSHLISGLTAADLNNTLIVIFVGETDLEYVLNIARQVEIKFPKHVANGLVEVISPSASYYPNLESLPLTLGDSFKRVKWRTKQNLDTIYLMAYAQTKGTFYLMLEDDVIAKNKYMQEIKHFTAATSVSTPNWYFLEFCHVGGIGKLFRSADLIHFITYVQLFYKNMPIDWLLESFLADRVCTIDKSVNNCGKNKLQIRPKYKSSLFQHIGVYSSLKGKIQKVKDPQFGALATYYPHDNPPLKRINTDIKEHSDHTVKRAYEGKTYFWGIKPKEGDVIEFWFAKPTAIASYIFRSGNVEHVSDKFYNTAVEVLPVNASKHFIFVDEFDEFGLAEGDLKRSFGPLLAIRIRVTKDSYYWTVLSEIGLKTFDKAKKS
ncbi:alpha-1,3-mannosyl-glycoprotein 4-beta-N-acetylglucosaminyltransferase A-like [Maniola jurtina]|uniref:alpha-1,3-mannosyl-glycoprotein 4-beta-N-acetylglucosaminyltransferase A-like n=1 Tax=Maniola jurtina TaxID=191418 RepID=UPI001E68708F|nr:alpha-1,3-mannosyl-glycoprotein 4-beta-N-acetylglucosaminyltransferase A-like [Maniola jurtina]